MAFRRGKARISAVRRWTNFCLCPGASEKARDRLTLLQLRLSLLVGF